MSDQDDVYRRGQELIRELEGLKGRTFFEGHGADPRDLREMVNVSRPHNARYPLPGQIHLLIKRLPGRGLFVYRTIYDIILARGSYSFPPDQLIEGIGDEEAKKRLRREKGAKAIRAVINWIEVKAQYFYDAERFRDAIVDAIAVLRMDPSSWMLKDPPPKDELGRERYLKDFMGERPSGVKWAEKELGGTDYATLHAHWQQFHATLSEVVTSSAAACEADFAKVAALNFDDVIRAWQKAEMVPWRQKVADETGLAPDDIDPVMYFPRVTVERMKELKSECPMYRVQVGHFVHHRMRVVVTEWYIEHRLKE